MGTIAMLVGLLSSGCYMVVGEGEPSAEARQFCSDKGFWECRRDQFAGRITDDEFDACVASITPTCEGFGWPAGCHPTEAEAGACIMILQSGELATVPTDELYATYTECNLCGP